MKLKEKILTAITMGIVVISTLIASTSVYAAKDPNGGLKLGLEAFRNSGFSYMAIEKIMWKISAYDSTGTTINDKNRGFYCLKGGPGFGSTDMGSVTPVKTNYTEKFDMKNPDSITAQYRAVLPSGGNYNSLVWVLDQCYVPQPSSNPTTEQIQIAKDYKRELITNAFNYYNRVINDENLEISQSDINYAVENMTDDELDIAQQFAVWYFTNTDIYKQKTIQLYIEKYPTLVTTSSMTLGDYYGDWTRDEYVNILLKYLIENGEANASKAPSSTASQNPITLASTNAVVSENSSNYILGPYTINQVVSGVDYTLEGSLAAADGSNNVAYTLLDSNKAQTSKSLKELVGSSFYISVPKTTQNVQALKFKVKATTYSTDITFWSVEGASRIEQPVAEVVRGKKTYELQASTSEFDLALRKFITKINDTQVTTSREPVVSADTIAKLKEGTVQTVTKTHTKTPLVIDTKDTVLYTIRIYNEGTVNGYAKEITDYLPEGLKLKENSTINSNYGWTNPSGDGKTIVTTKLSDTLLKAFDGTNVAYADVEIECVVTATYSASADTIFKNVAEITKHSNEAGDETVVDRDSIPDNLSDSQKQKYNPGTSEQGFGYEDDDDYEDLLLPKQKFDLALRKYITAINGEELKNSDGTYSREPKIDVSNLANKTATTAQYKHIKEPVGVAVGDIVIYTIRVYNEGKVDGYASEVTDYLPPQLEFVVDDEENFNAKYGWIIDSSLRKAKTANLARTEIDPQDNLLKAFNGTALDYRELKIKCRVKSVENLDEVITNIAEITEFTDVDGNKVTDVDSSAKNINLPTDTDLPSYKGNSSNKSVLSDANYFYKGQEDDDDFEKLILEEFDLALRKFITAVNDIKITSREPVFTKVIDENGNYIYEHTKVPVEVESTDVVEYTIRIYNEGDIAGYAKLVKDDIPEGLEFLPNNETNKEYRWIMLDKDGKQTDNVQKAEYITTDYLSKEQEKDTDGNLIKAFEQETMSSPDYLDVKAVFKVIAPNTHPDIITNIAEIADDTDEKGNPVIDRDSVPDNGEEKEDDIDVEHIKLKYFDLALRKFITAVNDEQIDTRYPKFTIDEEGKYVYNHTKEPVDVVNGDTVVYTLRIYNEGTKAGYAQEVKDDIPEGLEFLPDNEINTQNRWVMLDEEGNQTDDVIKAADIKTDILSIEQNKEGNLLKEFDKDTMKEPDYRDIKVAFKVTEPNTSDRIIINQAQISEDANESGNPVVDVDSTPDKWVEGEDDQDIEKIKVKYFDLALRKWVTQAIVIENGKETVTETGHKAEDDPEEVVKVELVQSKINKVVVKFRYKIRVTNEGEIAGYATELSDYIPEGLKFVQADNPNWKETEGKIVTDQLKDTLLQPGESAEVEVLLTWINGKDNLDLKVNVAEISEDKNDSDTPDIDSTPNNKKEGEDDIDNAPVILSVKTGGNIQIEYIVVASGALILIAAGAILIKKFVLI